METELIESLRNYELTCPCCKRKTPLNEWGFVQTYWYESPHGCTGGDNWWAHDDIKQCLLICPHNCHPQGGCLATRIFDFKLSRQEMDWVFTLIQKETHLYESDIKLIFNNHYVQHGRGKEIKSSEELRKESEEIYF